MTEKKTAKYVISEPVPNKWNFKGDIKGRSWPHPVYLDENIIEGCPVSMEISWIFQITEPNPNISEHTHDYDQLLMFVGTNPDDPLDLGAELELQLEGEKHIINKTTAIYIPKGMKHCPITHIRVDRPYRNFTISLQGDYKSIRE